jgi:aryl-alcohol dehydrogenase-like predicted oxidoreductase
MQDGSLYERNADADVPAVSALGVGTNRWGGIGAARPRLRTVFEAALSAGLTLFDTAEIYGPGGSERTLGAALKAAASHSARPVILTKFFPYPWRLRRGALKAALGASLERLGVPRVDIYLIHFPTPPLAIETWVDALADAVEAGLVRAAGVSNYNVAQMKRAHRVLAARGIPLAYNEVEYSLLNRQAERKGLLAACRDLGVRLIAYRPLGLGRLVRPEVGGLAALLARTAAAHERTIAQVALNWVIQKGALPIPGATSARHVEENAGALGWSLTQDEVARLDDASG